METDRIIGYRITLVAGRYHIYERNVVTTKTLWGLWSKKRYYTSSVRVFNTRPEATAHMHKLIEQAAIIVDSDDYNLKGNLDHTSYY